MSDSLRKSLAHSQVQREKAGRQGWSQEAWVTALRSYRTLGPPAKKQFPIVIGAGSVFKTAESLRDFLCLPSIPAATRADRVVFKELADEPVDTPTTSKLDVCDVDMAQFVQLGRRTHGKTISVLFNGKKRAAWYARSPK